MSAITETQAAELWGALRSNLLAVEDGIRQIIASKAWEPLGYESFAECWQDRLGDLKLSKELRAVVVFAMFEDDATPADAARAVAGTGVVEVKQLHTAFQQGMDAKDAAFVSRSRTRRGSVPGQPKEIKVVFSESEYAEIRSAAAEADAGLAEFARACVLRSLAVWRRAA